MDIFFYKREGEREDYTEAYDNLTYAPPFKQGEQHDVAICRAENKSDAVEIFKKYFTVCDESYVLFKNEIEAKLVRCDMDIHLLKADGVEEFCKNPLAITLLLTGLAEIHSNDSMFGGLNSVSFLIKKKSLTQRGKQI